MPTREEMLAHFQEMLDAEYQRGRQDGLDAMRKAILDLAATNLHVEGQEVELRHTLRTDHLMPAQLRAPRGAVERALEEVLTAEPGLTITEIEDKVVELDPNISRKSVGNTLRRQEMRKFRRDRSGGYRWYVLTQEDAQSLALDSRPGEGS